MRPRVALPTLRTDRDFRWRGGDVSRVEAISDAVFALALTLLIVSLEIPRTFDELVQIFRLAPLFLVCFFLIIMIWYFHYLFHRRYGLEDFITIVLNSLLLFVVLMYVYPLKFLFSLLLSGMTGVGGMVPGADGQLVPVIASTQMWQLMVLYSSGVVAIFLLMTALEWHAYRLRDELGLNALERATSRSMIRTHLISVGYGGASIVLAVAGQPELAGVIYFGIGPTAGIHGWLSGRAAQKLREPDVAEFGVRERTDDD